MTDQLALFAPPAPSAPQKTLHETELERRYATARSPEVIDEVLAALRALPAGEFVNAYWACYDIWHRHAISADHGFTLHHMVKLGLLEENRICHGAESPVGAPKPNQKPRRGKQAPLEKPHLGYSTLHRIKEAA